MRYFKKLTNHDIEWKIITTYLDLGKQRQRKKSKKLIENLDILRTVLPEELIENIQQWHVFANIWM